MLNPFLSKFKYTRRLPKEFFNLSSQRKNEHNELLCFICDQVAKKEEYYKNTCGLLCLDELNFRSNDSKLRKAVLDRDKYRCCECGVSGLELEKALAILKKLNGKAWLKKIEKLNIPEWRTKAARLFDADHIKPINSGNGAGTEIPRILTNLQTLCLLCHKFKNKQDDPSSKK